MENKKRFVSIKTKNMLYTLIPVVISFVLMSSVFVAALLNSQHNTAKADFTRIGEKHADSFKMQIDNAVNYLTLVSQNLEFQLQNHMVDRERLQQELFQQFDGYGLVDGSSVYFEPNAYDGKDAEYVGTNYGTSRSGRICYYYYKDGGKTAYLPEALEEEEEFGLPHYMDAKKANAPIYTKPVVYEIEGRVIPMFTITFPVRDAEGRFIGAVTTDLFLDDLYEQLQKEKIYKTGYVVITNDKGQVIYSPNFDDIGKSRREVGLLYVLPSEGGEYVTYNTKSLVNGQTAFSVVESIYIPQLDNYFYIGVAAPLREINEVGAQWATMLGLFSMVLITIIALLLYWTNDKITMPIKRITERANRIANGDMEKEGTFTLGYKTGKTTDEIHTLYEALEKMLKQLNEVQGLKLEALTLMYEKESAEESSRVKSEFLANMSHEIRTPMNAIIGMSELLLNEHLTVRQKGYVNDINLSSHSLLGIINDILDLSKIESGKLELVPVDYDFHMFMDNICSMFRFVAEKKNLQFKFEQIGELPKCLYGDDIRLRQVLTNICGNAVKFTNEGFIHLSVSVAGNTLVFEVADTGMGIRKEDMPKLFQAFSQADEKKNRNVKGTGLGLAISKSFVELMGGEITLDSVYGEGTVFTIGIPFLLGDLDAVSQEAGNAKEEANTLKAPSARILVVDDNELNLKVAVGLLRLFGIGAVTSSSGKEAMERVKEEEFDIVFMDHMMPDMDGVETTKRIREMGGRFKEMVVVALTANAVRGAKEMFLSSGFNEFLSKPIDVGELTEVLRKWLPKEKMDEGPEAEQVETVEGEEEGSKDFLEGVRRIGEVNVEIGLSRVSGMEDMYRETLELFYKKMANECGKMENYLKEKDLANFAILVHGMKSSLSTIGAMELSELALRLEEASKGGDGGYCEERFPELSQKLAALKEKLAPLFPKEVARDKEEGDVESLKKGVEKALAAADDFDGDACAEALKAMLVYNYGESVNELLGKANDAIADFDFDNVLEYLKQALEQL